MEFFKSHLIVFLSKLYLIDLVYMNYLSLNRENTYILKFGYCFITV